MTVFQKLSDAEMEVMQAVWDAEGSVTSSYIQQKLASHAWKPTTVLTFLKRLTQKGMLSYTREGKTNVYAPLVSRDAYTQAQTRVFLEQVHHGSVQSLMASLCGGDTATTEEIRALREWLETL